MRYFFILLLLPLAVFAGDKCDFSGVYDLAGWHDTDNFSKAPTYTGTIKVFEYNNTYRFEGSANGTIYFGKGLTHDCKTLAFVFSSPDKTKTGVTLCTKSGKDLNATWTFNLPDTSGAGKEVWTRKQ